MGKTKITTLRKLSNLSIPKIIKYKIVRQIKRENKSSEKITDRPSTALEKQ